MKRTIHQLTQGSPEWLAHRALIRNASEAATVMGASKYQTRGVLITQKATGLAPEVSAARQALFDRGHAVEGPTIALIEEDIGDSLAPVVASVEIDGLTLGASYDGLSLLEDVGAEVKLWNEDLARQIASGVLDMHYVWQLEQQFIVTPSLERIIFATSDGTRERFASMEYRPVPGRREQLIAAWRQFDADLASYTPPAAAAPAVVAAAVQALPAVSVRVTGEITIVDNFPAFEIALRDFLEHRLIRTPKTDQDFADLDMQIKAMKGAEAALESAETQMLAQIVAVDTATKAKNMLAKLVRDNRLMAEKLLTSEKERRRGEIVAGGIAALRDHVAALNKRLGENYMPTIAADFGAAVRGMKKLDNMQDAVGTELARAKIAASEAADRVQANLNLIDAQPMHLFRDVATLVHKDPEAVNAIIAGRLAEEERRQNAERSRIQAEEQAKAEKAAREKIEAEQRAAAAAAAPAPTAAPAQPLAAAPIASPVVSSQAAKVVPLGTRAPATPPSLRLGQINERIAPLSLTAEGLRGLGFEPAGRERAAVLYHEADFLPIVRAAIAHLEDVAEQRQAA